MTDLPPNADGIGRLDAAIERYEAKCAELRDVERDVNATLKEGRRLLRDLERATAEFDAKLADLAGERLGQTLKELIDPQFAIITEELLAGVKETRAKVDRDVHEWANFCMYGNRQGRGPNIFEQLRDAALAAQLRSDGL